MHFKRSHKDLAPPEWLDVQVRAAMSAQAKEGAGPSRQLNEPAASGSGSPPPATGARDEKQLQAIRQDLENGLKTVAGWVYMFGLQVTGVAAHNRADRLSYQALVFAQRSEPVMRGILAFNTFMRSEELIELGSALTMSVGYDLGILHPAKRVRLGPVNVPGFMFLQPIASDIQEVAQMQEKADVLKREFEAAQAAAAGNGRAQPQEAPAG
jgi:hypothetical protein